MGIHYMQKLHASNVPKELVEKGQNRVIEASLTLIRERAKLKVCYFEWDRGGSRILWVSYS